MPLHYFHCTNGEDVIFDRRGSPADRSSDLRETARGVARRLMRRLPRYPDWSSWAVCIYDGEGRCLDEVPFPASRAVPHRHQDAPVRAAA